MHNPYLPSENPHGREEGAGFWGGQAGGLCHEVGLGAKLQTKNCLRLPSQSGGRQRVPLAGGRLGAGWVLPGAAQRLSRPPPKGQMVTLGILHHPKVGFCSGSCWAWNW